VGRPDGRQRITPADPRLRAVAAETLPAGDATFHRQTTIHPEMPTPGTTDLVAHILAAYAYHLNVMPLDARMPDGRSALGRASAAQRQQATTACAEPSPAPLRDHLEDRAGQITTTR
jgi:hypothetical protein